MGARPLAACAIAFERARLEEPNRDPIHLWVFHRAEGTSEGDSVFPPSPAPLARNRGRERWTFGSGARLRRPGLEGACPRAEHPDVRTESTALAARVTSRVTGPAPPRARTRRSFRVTDEPRGAALEKANDTDESSRTPFARLRARPARHREELRPVRARPRDSSAALSRGFGRRDRKMRPTDVCTPNNRLRVLRASCVPSDVISGAWLSPSRHCRLRRLSPPILVCAGSSARHLFVRMSSGAKRRAPKSSGRFGA